MAAGGVLDVEVRYLDADGDPVVTLLRELGARRAVRGRPVRKLSPADEAQALQDALAAGVPIPVAPSASAARTRTPGTPNA